MDIHRCRFVPFPVSSINALAFNRTYIPDQQKSKKSVPVRLAVGRENGDIEIWNPQDGIWHQEVVMPGGMGRKIDALVWATEPDLELGDGKVVFGGSRLFSFGGAASITEWDLAKGRARKHASGQHGDIWCLALQPAPASHATLGEGASRLVAGTGDGCLALYSIDDDDLRLERILVKSPSRKVHFVSIAFQSRNVVAVGCSDASIRIYDMRNGSTIRKMTLGRDLTGGSKDIIVWCVKALPSGDIVSGDSTGQVCIWDGRTYTQAQRLQSHNQDVLSLAIGADGSTIVSGGMDRRTVLHRCMASQSSQNSRWSKVFHRRYHAHDVKAMASFEGRGMSVVVSGGSDATPIVIPLREAGLENHKTLSHLPQSVPLLSSPAARLMVSWWGREIHVWRFPSRESLDVDGELEGFKSPRILKKILLKGTSDITSASISKNGSFLAVSTTTELKLFHLSLETGDFDKAALKITKITIPDSIAVDGATLVRVSPDGRWICLIREGAEVVLVRLRLDVLSGRLSVLSDIRPLKLRKQRRNVPAYSRALALGSYSRRITQATFSPDSKMLATADLSGYIDTWILKEGGAVPPHSPRASGDGSASESDESSDDEGPANGHLDRWLRNPNGDLVPKLPTAVTVLSFSEKTPATAGKSELDDNISQDYELLAMTTTSRILVFHPMSGLLTTWSRRNPHAKLPEALRLSRDIVKGALWQGHRVWLYGASSLFMLDMSRDLWKNQDLDGPLGDGGHGIKRKRAATTSGAGGRMDIGSLGPQKVGKTISRLDRDEWVDVEMADVDEPPQGTLDQDHDQDEDDETDGGELQLLREGDVADGEAGKEKEHGPGWWHTYKYRPILGAVALGTLHGDATLGDVLDESSNGSHRLPEVVLVERPLWDVPLAARYVAEEGREARDLL